MTEGTRKPRHIIIWRDSTCAGDDCDAPHELILEKPAETLGSLIKELVEARYLPSISGGKATWILQAGESEGKALAVLAQQWPQPRYLVHSNAAVLAHIVPDANPHFYLRYWCQADPDEVFRCLQRGAPLPGKYGS